MVSLDFEAIRSAPVSDTPFRHFVAPRVLTGDSLKAVNTDYPAVDRPGSFPLETLRYGGAFRDLVAQLRGPELTRIMEEKLDIDLAGRPTMLTVRGICRSSDGQIHTDSKGKLVTALLYMNTEWNADGGRLRLLRKPDDLEDYVSEVPPEEGTLLVFRNEANAWHGHKPFDGPRRTLQLNWVVGNAYLVREKVRHTISAFAKRLKGAA